MSQEPTNEENGFVVSTSVDSVFALRIARKYKITLRISDALPTALSLFQIGCERWLEGRDLKLRAEQKAAHSEDLPRNSRV